MTDGPNVCQWCQLILLKFLCVFTQSQLDDLSLINQRQANHTKLLECVFTRFEGSWFELKNNKKVDDRPPIPPMPSLWSKITTFFYIEIGKEMDGGVRGQWGGVRLYLVGNWLWHKRFVARWLQRRQKLGFKVWTAPKEFKVQRILKGLRMAKLKIYIC